MNDFTRAFTRLRSLVLTQRTVRLLVRAAWTGMAGYLIAWGLSVRTELFTSQSGRFLLAALFAAPWLAAAARPFPFRRLAWRLDRLFGLDEQVTTAWEISQAGSQPNRMEGFLLRDAGRLIPEAHTRIMRRGWFLGRDLQALVLTVTLLFAVIFSGQIAAPSGLSGAAPESLPALDQPPGFKDVFPSGIPGLTDAPGTDSDGTLNGQSDPSGAADAGALNDVLNELGKALGQDPETADIGEALENGDLEAAAAALEQTADSIDQLPEPVRQDMQQALEQAASQSRDAGQEDLASDLEAAAQALGNQDPNSPFAADQLDQLADKFRSLAEIFASMGQSAEDDGSAPAENAPQVGSTGGASGSGSGQGGQGQPEPLSRLEGEGQDFTLEGGDTPSGLLQPGSSPAAGNVPGGGATYFPADGSPASTGTVNSILTPYSFPWRWRDVVSQYFSP